MEGLKALGQLLMVPSVIILLWDLCEHWFVKNMFKVRTIKEWGNKMSPKSYQMFQDGLHSFLPHQTCEQIAAAPGFLFFLVPGLFFYLLYRLIFLLQGGKAGGYKSRY